MSPENTIAYLTEITRSYTLLHMCTMLELYIKIEPGNKPLTTFLREKTINEIQKQEKILEWVYIQWKYVEEWVKTSLLDEQWHGILQETALILCCANIAGKFFELMKDNHFDKSLKAFFTENYPNDYANFRNFINLIRHINLHWSLDKNYQLKETDFTKWILPNGVYQTDLTKRIWPNGFVQTDLTK